VPDELRDLATLEAEEFHRMEIHNDEDMDSQNNMEDSNDFSLEEALD